MNIYHIVLPERWAQFETKEFYEAESLETEGFIHCSYENQLPGVIERYYKSVAQILILTIDPEKLSSDLVLEESTGGEFYPHIYGPLNKSAIIDIKPRNA